MSYILDALQRAHAERERERGAVPGLHTPAPPPAALNPQPATRMGKDRLAAMATFTVVALVAAGFWWQTRPERPTEPRAGTPAQPEVRPEHLASAAPPAPPPTRPPVPAEAPAEATAAPKTAAAAVTAADPTPTSVSAKAQARAPEPPRAPVKATTPAPTPAPAPAAASAGSATISPKQTHTATKPTVTASAAAGPAQKSPAPAASAPTPSPSQVSTPWPLLSELPEALRRGLPPLVITGAVHASNPTQRLLIVNNQVLTQGSALAGGVTLEDIQPTESIFSVQGQRFRVRH